MTALDLDDDALVDILVHAGTDFSFVHAQYFHAVEPVNGEPRFLDDTSIVFNQTPPGAFSGAPNAADFDNDGDLDVLVPTLDSTSGSARLYEQVPGGTLVDVAASRGIDGQYAFSSWGDFDGDGWLDLAVSGGNAFGVYHNVDVAGVRAFEQEVIQLGVLECDPSPPGDCDVVCAGEWGRPVVEGPVAWVDIDGDLDLDIVLVEQGTDIARASCRGSIIIENTGLSSDWFVPASYSLYGAFTEYQGAGSIAYVDLFANDGLQLPELVIGGRVASIWANGASGLSSFPISVPAIGGPISSAY